MKKEDIIIVNEKLSEFEIDEDFSIFYSHSNNIWFIEDYSEDGKIIILEDLSEGILMEETFLYKDAEITNELIKEYKDLIDAN